MLGHVPQLSTHHADLSCHEVAQSVEPFHVSLQIVSLVTETRLGKTQGPHSVFLSITFGHEVSSSFILIDNLENAETSKPSTNTNDLMCILPVFFLYMQRCNSI